MGSINYRAEHQKISKQLDLFKEFVNDRTSSLDKNFFNKTVIKLNTTLKADYSFIGKLNDDKEGVSTLAVCNREGLIDNISYSLQNSPCEKVIGNKICTIPKGVSKLFPKDKLLVDMNIEAFVGVPLFDLNHEPNGILVSLFLHPIQEIESTDFVLLLANRVGAELEHQKLYSEICKSQELIENKSKEFESLNKQYVSINNELNKNIVELRKSRDNVIEINKKLTETERRFELLFEYSGTANSFFDLNGVLLFQNALSARHLGGNAEQLKGKTIYEIFGEKQAKVISSRFDKVIEYAKSLTFETSFNLPAGTRWFKTIYQPVFQDNALIGIQLISQEITNEKEAEMKLFESERSYSTLVETATDLITKVDSEGIYTFVNHAASIFFGLRPEECIGKSAFEFIHEKDREATLLAFEKWNNSKDVRFSYENRLLHKNGSHRFVSWNIFARRNKRGKILQFTSIGRDITERKKLEIELIKAKNKAEESDRLKTAFLANMSHEIRTPMNGILGFAELMANPDLKSEKRIHYSQVIQTSSNQLMNIISDIIDISKIQAEEFQVTNSVFSIEEFLKELLEQAEVLLIEKNKEHLQLSYSNLTAYDNICTDKNRLAQIILNLLSNAIKFTNHGNIQLICNEADENHTRFTVTDTGKGIDKAKHKVIFERFRQANEGESFEGGTGLGLAICKLLVEKLGGTIELYSELGKGSRFTFSVNNHTTLSD